MKKIISILILITFSLNTAFSQNSKFYKVQIYIPDLNAKPQDIEALKEKYKTQFLASMDASLKLTRGLKLEKSELDKLNHYCRMNLEMNDIERMLNTFNKTEEGKSTKHEERMKNYLRAKEIINKYVKINVTILNKKANNKNSRATAYYNPNYKKGKTSDEPKTIKIRNSKKYIIHVEKNNNGEKTIDKPDDICEACQSVTSAGIITPIPIILDKLLKELLDKKKKKKKKKSKAAKSKHDSPPADSCYQERSNSFLHDISMNLTEEEKAKRKQQINDKCKKLFLRMYDELNFINLN